MALTVGTAMAVTAYIGHYVILSGYDLSRDEQMAMFDAAVFAQGQLVAPVTGVWRQHAEALNTMFMYTADPRAAWVSDYLPLNAALRAILGVVATSVLTGPVMILLGALALHGCIRRIWPENLEVSVVGLLLYAGSAQILANGMTAYAMPAHLALNVCWLWLFLQRCVWADVAALAVGFVAVGLHQPLMHPMFAAPILVLLLLERNWRRAAWYFVGYAVIGLFWLWWPHWISSLVQADDVTQHVRDADYLTRLLNALTASDGLRVINMIANLLRFIVWQHLLLVPLLILGLAVARRDRLAGSLVAGILLTLATMTVILPYQGHGFGYRYLHGLIGNFILLALFGWTSMAGALPRWRPLLIRTTFAGLVVLLPVQMWMAHAFYAAPARASKQIDRVNADYAVIGAGDAPFAADLVINRPYLDQRPVRLLRERIDPAAAREICADQPSVALIGSELTEPIVDYYGFGRGKDGDTANQKVELMLRRAGCDIAP